MVLTHLLQYGFDNRIYGQAFHKHIDAGRAAVHLSFHNYADDFDIAVDVAIRFDDLEDLKNEINTILNPKQKAETYSIGSELGNLSERKMKCWSVYVWTDIEPVVKSICKMIDEVAIPYIEKYQYMETAFEMMLRDDSKIWLFAPIHYERAMNALGLAKLLGKENIREIGDAKRKFLTDFNDFGLNIYNNFYEKILNEEPEIK